MTRSSGPRPAQQLASFPFTTANLDQREAELLGALDKPETPSRIPGNDPISRGRRWRKFTFMPSGRARVGLDDHHGRSSDLVEAIETHFSASGCTEDDCYGPSEANEVIARFNALSKRDKQAVLDFLRSL